MAAPKNAGGVLQEGVAPGIVCLFTNAGLAPLQGWFLGWFWRLYWRVGRKGVMKPPENLTKQEHSGPLQSLSSKSLALYSLIQSESHINPPQSLHDEESE